MSTDKNSAKFGKLYYNITIFCNGIDSHLHFIRINYFKGSIHMTQSILREKYSQLTYNVTVSDNYDNMKTSINEYHKTFKIDK